MNVPPDLHEALKQLARMRNQVIIRKADKGSAVVLQDFDNYVQEGNRQLSNKEFYQPLEEEIYPATYNIFKEILQRLEKVPGEVGSDKGGHTAGISQKQLEFLLPPSLREVRERRFYMLPKIHKDPLKWTVPHLIPPGRPIISDCSSEGYQIAAFLDYFLQPIATSHPSYLKDTNHFLDRLKEIQAEETSILVTADVDAMYTNISHDSGLKAVARALKAHPPTEEHPRIPDSYLLELLRVSLERNDFLFNGKFYLQVKGTAMGKKFAPSYANIFMADWEQRMLEGATLKPQNWDRFLDDIFMVWDHGKEALDTFFTYLNQDDPNVQLKQEIDEQEVNFLDITVFKGSTMAQKRLSTKVYRKPTDTMELLHKTSYHPQHTFRGIIKSQVLRFKRLCTEETHFEDACRTLFEALTPRGYTWSFLNSIKTNTLTQMENPTKGSTLLDSSIEPRRSSKCGHRNCKVCPIIKEASSFRSTTTGKTYPILHDLDCSSTSVIYLITCTRCQLQYVGETSLTIRHRFWKYRNRIDKGPHPLNPSLVEEHFRVENFHEGLADMEVTLIGTHQSMTRDTAFISAHRHTKEDFWMEELRTIFPLGLNFKAPGSYSILPFIIPYNEERLRWARQTMKHWNWSTRPKHHPYLKNRVLAACSKGPNLTAFLSRAELIDPDAPCIEHHTNPDFSYTLKDLTDLAENKDPPMLTIQDVEEWLAQEDPADR